ncbi:MAG: helix-turn-helix domain-containing protein [Ruminococcaceae bacterium]|nr:helix-turn-helix domain-containing protein [Oscillospiraceae bacterium]
MSYSNYEKLLKLKRSTSYKVAKATGIAPSTLSDWKNGRSVPKTDKMKLIAEYFGVDIGHLVGDDIDFDYSEFNMENEAEFCGRKMVPIIGEIRAGQPIITNETLLGYESADIGENDERDYFYLTVCGDSMKDCGMVDGSLVLFRKQQYAEEGNIVACLVGGECATVKRFHIEKRRIYLVPENDDYEPIELTPEDFESGNARILGIAIEMKIKF